MNRHIFLYGFSIFSMFFGSGNLVFPLVVGVENSANWLGGFLGLFITGIILPFLGLFVIKLHNGNYNKFFAEAGNLAMYLIPFFTLSLLGSFGVIPRCITVAHGGLEFLYNEISLTIFSLTFCISCYIFCLNDKIMFNVLGKFLTPILLLFLTWLIIIGTKNSGDIVTNKELFWPNFTDGFFRGYSTMDLFAAFFFSSLIFKQMQSILPTDASNKDVLKAAIKPSILGAMLLGVIYFGFVFLGAQYKDLAQGLPGELILPTIANHLLGKNGALAISVIIILSCLTTAVALNNIYAKYLCSLKIFNKISFQVMLILTTSASFIISLFDFNGIASVLGPLLEISYPSLIILTIFSICTQNYKRLKAFVFYGVIVLMIVI